MAGHDPDLPFFEWIAGLAFAAISAALGHLHIRVNREEDARMKETSDGATAVSGAETKLWKAFEEHRNEFQQFRGVMMETAVRRADLRADLHDMEGRLAQAQREMEARLVMMLRLPQQDRAP